MTLKDEMKAIVKEAVQEVLSELNISSVTAPEVVEAPAEVKPEPKKKAPKKKATKKVETPKVEEPVSDTHLDVSDVAEEEVKAPVSPEDFFKKILNLVSDNPDMKGEVAEVCEKLAGTYKIKEITDSKIISEILDALNIS